MIAKFSLRPILFAAALSGLAGFAVAKAAPDYVGNLDGLTSISQSGFDSVYAKSGALPKGYNSVFVAPVGVIEGQDPRLDGLAPNERQEMQDYLHRQLTRTLGKKFTLADSAGAGVLVVAASFTALTPNKPTMSDLAAEPGLDYGRSFGIGKAGVQIDLRDGASGELLAAFVDHDEGDPLNFNTNAIVQWGDAQEFSRDWAQSLAETLGS